MGNIGAFGASDQFAAWGLEFGQAKLGCLMDTCDGGLGRYGFILKPPRTPPTKLLRKMSLPQMPLCLPSTYD